MRNWMHMIKKDFSDKAFIVSFAMGWMLLVLSLVVSYYAGIYATERASNAVTDVILSNTRAYDLDGVFLYGPLFFWIFVTVISVIKPRRAPFVLKSIALFVVIRSFFISLTHIGPFPLELDTGNVSSLINTFFFGGDLFFSGHTGLPFLMALIYWHTKWLRLVFICAALFFGAVVLLAHLHYSIDVLSAFFITYTIFHLAQYFFKKEYSAFLGHS